MATMVDLQKLNSEVTYRRFVEILEQPKNGTFRAICWEDCYNCGGRLRVDGYFSTGEKLASGYTPTYGELVKNNVMECQDCGDWQVS